jgi:hypothetical protein
MKETIKLEKPVFNYAKGIYNEILGAEVALKYAADVKRTSTDALWNFIFREYPQLKGAHLTIDWEKEEIIIVCDNGVADHE